MPTEEIDRDGEWCRQAVAAMLKRVLAWAASEFDPRLWGLS